MVAKLFINNINNYPEVNHKDFDRTNNHVDNLEWETHEYNIKYTVLHNRHIARDGRMKGENNPNYNNNSLKLKYMNNPELAKLNNSRPKEQNGRARKIQLYDINNNYIDTFEYIGACAEYLRDNNFTKAKVDSIRGNIILSINNNKSYLKHYYKFVS